MSEYLDFAEDLAKESGEIMRRYFRAADIGTEIKDDNSPVTIADTKINSLIINAVKEQFPDHGVLGEEESYNQESDYLWVCDPIDGTLPYVHGIPISTFNLALTQSGRTIAAVQYDPYMDGLYSAVKGGGTRLNGQIVKVKDDFDARIPANIEIYTRNSRTLFNDHYIQPEIEVALLEKGFAALRFVSIGYSVGLVACGELGAAIFSGLHPYEAATCSLLTTEAGGKFTNIFGEQDERYDKPIRGFIAASPKIHQVILDSILPVVKKAKLTEPQ